MIKKSINVIDLDRTLIPYDSLRVMVKRELFKFDLTMIWYTLLRVFRLSSKEGYKKRLIIYLQKKYKKEYFKKYTDSLFEDINKDVFRIIQKETDGKTINILLSASPDMYVKFLIIKLKWEGRGSFFNENGSFIHLYGKDKIKWLQDNYNDKDYNYNYAISDSTSDKELLSFFDKYLLLKPLT